MEEPPLNVLLVDDQPHALFAMRQALHKTGAHILEARSGHEALRLVLGHECAVILLDVHMPEMDGFETSRLLRSTERTRHIPILFITGVDGGDETLLKGYQAGGVDFIRKPVSSELLVAKVSAFLEMFRRRREEEKNNRLQQELRQQQVDAEHLHELAGYLQEAREEERKHISHEVHDELGSRLAMIKMELLHNRQNPAVAWLDPLLEQVEEAIKAVRRVAVSLRPPILDEMGLFGALEWLARDFSSHSPMQVALTDSSQNVALPDPLKIALFRMAQEALTNALRHGDARRVDIGLRRQRGRIHLSLADDGRGLSEASQSTGMGFRGMEERLRPFGGVVKLERSALGGVLLTAVVPEP